MLGAPMRAELGASELFVFSAFTAGLLVSGALSPFAGRLIDRRGGRFVLCSGSILGAIAMTIVALARDPAVMAIGWLVAGAAMSACLYDPAFATLSQHMGERYRKSVAALTLFGGFASTVFWPVSQWLLDHVGWRQSFLAYAALHALVCFPIHRWMVPEKPAARHADAGARAEGELPRDKRLGWLTASMGLVSLVVGILAVHVISLLKSAGLSAQQAVTVAMLFGPMQVAGRIVEITFAHRVSAATVGLVSYVLLAFALLALIGVDGLGAMAFVFVVLYGVGNGVLTIVGGTVPAELFGRVGLGAILGHLSRARLLARAVAPACFTGLLTLGLTRNETLAGLVGVMIAAAACYAAGTRSTPS